MADIDESELEVRPPVFDPVAFQRDHPDPKLDVYRLSVGELRERGLQVSLLRDLMLDKAK